MACATLPWSKNIYDYVRDWGDCKAEATVAHYGYKTKVENAVFANSSFGHGFAYPIRRDREGPIVGIAQAEPQPLPVGQRVHISYGDRVRVLPVY